MSLVLDTTILAKGIIPPRRRKRDEIYEKRLALHELAKDILKEIEEERETAFVPFLALIEMAAVGARLTGKKERGLEAADYVRSHTTLLPEFRVSTEAVDVAAETKASGFDSLFIACAKLTDSTLVTDDKGMHEAAPKVGVTSDLLRDRLPTDETQGR